MCQKIGKVRHVIIHRALFMSIFTGSAMLPTACTERLLSITPCAYPLLSDTVHCGIDDADLRRNVRVCDPDKAISMSEVKVIKDKLDTIYNRKDKYCVCRKDQLRPCWFRFGFAFLRQMLPVESGVSHLYSREFCPANETLLRYTKNNAVIHSTRESVTHYGKNFARLLRERWLMGECEEDILFLVLLRRPDSLVNRVTLPYVASRAVHRTPYIFASYGSLVREKIDTLNLVDENFPLNYHQADPLQKIVEAENANLENGYSLKAAVEQLLDRFAMTLTQAEEMYASPRARSHIPDWAVIVFIACAFLCLLMAIGLCLMRTQVRRGSPRNKPLDTSRRWKAGFVGETLEGIPTGGVNLMQMMIQPSLRYSNNPINNYA